MLKTGDKAPALSLLDQNSKKVLLKNFANKKVLLYFYPKADTPGCTVQSCLLRDIRKDIGKFMKSTLGFVAEWNKKTFAW